MATLPVVVVVQADDHAEFGCSLDRDRARSKIIVVEVAFERVREASLDVETVDAGVMHVIHLTPDLIMVRWLVPEPVRGRPMPRIRGDEGALVGTRPAHKWCVVGQRSTDSARIAPSSARARGESGGGSSFSPYVNSAYRTAPSTIAMTTPRLLWAMTPS